MIVLDASVLIAHLDEDDAQHARAHDLFEVISECEWGASSLTLAEVLAGPARGGRLEAAQAALQALEIQEVPVGANAAVRLARLRAETSLKLPDCCVILAAQDVQGGIATFDERLEKAAARLDLA